MVKTWGYGKIFSIYGKEALVYGQNQLAFISGPIKSLFQSFCGLLVIVPARNCRQHKIVYLINLYVNRSSKLLRFFSPGLASPKSSMTAKTGLKEVDEFLIHSVYVMFASANNYPQFFETIRPILTNMKCL